MTQHPSGAAKGDVENPSLRFAILRHTYPPGSDRADHWDLLLEKRDAGDETSNALLRTWALNELPAPGRSVLATALPDHRAVYLSYEGPISGGRGEVARHDGGVYWIEREDPRELQVVLNSTRGRATWRLSRPNVASLQWIVEELAEAESITASSI